jgi:peroxidase
MKKPMQKLSIELLEVRALMSGSPPFSGPMPPPPSSSSPASPLAGDNVVAQYSVDGTGNNVANPTWGSDDTDLLRTAPAQYADGLSQPSGSNRPSARVISNTVSAQGNVDIPSDRSLSAFAYSWGQFIDHDIDLTPDGTDPFNIQVPTGDPSFDPNSTGTQVIPLNRSQYDPATGTTDPREQVNVITSFMDGSMIYGSDATTAAALRTFSGGLLKTSPGDLLPYNNSTYLGSTTLNMANDAQIVPEDQLFAAGDVRANENIELTSLQTLFVREHNYWATQIAKANPKLNDEQIFQRARAIVIGEIQSITYNEWLPAVLGKNALTSYQGYDPSVNPSIANEFSTAAFRFGHSMLGDDVEFLDNNGLPVAPAVELSQAFFYPPLVSQNGIDPLLKYMASDPSSEIDTKVVDSVRNFLFGPPGSGGLDLASLNIQRGRDHGLADYNTVRAAYGLPKVKNFAQITSDPTLQAELKQLYGSVNNIDLWVGALAEDHVKGSSVGPTLMAIISDQFERLRDGDRFFYEREFSGKLLQQIDNTTLADVIERNSDITNLQANVFFFQASISGTVSTNSGGRMGGRQQQQTGVPGITVELISAVDGSIVATTTTDRRGNYSFDVTDGLGTGKYQIEILPPDGSNANTKISRVVTITRGDQSIDIDFLFGLLGQNDPTGGWNGCGDM